MRYIAAALYKTVTLSWLTGPIFDKELRISSRRKRNYLLRVGYLAVLLLVLILIWAEEMGMRTQSMVYQTSRLSQAGLIITGITVIVQFYAAQMIAVIMLSNSISDEIYNKTLGVLMSTPISSLQVVAGKILSKLLQILLLLCMTLPILGIIRVFGGVPWTFLVQSFCLTLTAVLFAAMVTLNFSIHHKHAFAVIIQTVLVGILVYALLPIFAAWISIGQFDMNEDTFLKGLMVLNPFLAMHMLVQELFSPHSVPFSTGFWGWNCLTMLAASVLLFLRAISVVRKKALMQACGQLNLRGKKKRFFRTQKAIKIRRVKGPPVLWKEMKQPIFNMGKIKKTLSLILFIGCLSFSYYICIKEDGLRYSGSHIMFAMVFSILGVFFTTVFSATAITSEKNSRTLPALLSTQVSDTQIIAAKVIGVLRRSSPYWLILFLHMLIFTGTYIHPAVWPHLFIIVVCMASFAACSGVLMSTLLKHTTSAVVANLIFIAFTWAGLPFLVGIFSAIMSGGDDLIELVIATNPFYHLCIVVDATCGINMSYSFEGIAGHVAAISTSWRELNYDWVFGNSMNFFETTVYLYIIGAAYIASGLFFLWIAKTQLRRKIF